jgi:hypothetical protein
MSISPPMLRTVVSGCDVQGESLPGWGFFRIKPLVVIGGWWPVVATMTTAQKARNPHRVR